MDLFETHSYKGAPSTVVDISRQTRDLLDDEGFQGIPIYITAYMDYFKQDFRKDTNHRAAQWLMTMMKLEEANRKEGLDVAHVATYAYKDFNTQEEWDCRWPYNDNRRFYGAFGLLTNIQYMGGLYKAIGNAFRMVDAMHS